MVTIATAPAKLSGVLTPGDGATLTANRAEPWPASTRLRVSTAGAEVELAPVIAGNAATWTLSIAQVAALIGTQTCGSLQARLTTGTGDALRGVAAGSLSILSKWAAR